ncbi:DUF5668 domain-containing protein [Paenibacillus validus]|uniref:LiaI-LiaF-like transmembrane region domain-containing protein n=1 Tax=Paenibacillus validus TaxID=44253 RepID=A0A7X3CT31_9BACL|nr:MULTISPECIES: DUF5668 domain-containing protein [Paenibacillus]MED4602156.1 DUF5668 domain-containing protein [Paenibacillus validus]MED4607729.1 DUF5668 domain-containing protein [Paenibacillus validus]MUG72400.1 hypothetical protein [Paenibacillus validus]
MRKWRVGTLSMGLTLIGFGVLLFLSQWQGLGAFTSFIRWWPIVLVLLGLEILAYVFIAKKESEVIRYDWMSVLFVGVLFAGCFMFTMLTGLGVTDEVRKLVGEVEVTADLPELQEPVNPAIQKLVVQTSGEPVRIDKTAERSMHLFGTYRTRVQEGDRPTVDKEQFYTVRTVGDTMYVQVKRPPVYRGLNSVYPEMSVTLVLPQDVQVEVQGPNNESNPG